MSTRNQTSTFDPQLAAWSCVTRNQEYPPLRTWNQRNAMVWHRNETDGPEDFDKLAFSRLVGFDIKQSDAQLDLITETTELNTQSVISWLQPDVVANLPPEKHLFRIVFSNQSMKNDSLHPPPECYPQCQQISKELLARWLHIPTCAPEKLGEGLTYTVTYPNVVNCQPAVRCHSVATNGCFVTWSYNNDTFTNSVFMVFPPKVGSADWERRQTIKIAKSMAAFSNLPNFVPYVLISRFIETATRALMAYEFDSNENPSNLIDELAEKDPDSVLRTVNIQLHAACDIVQEANVILKMIQTETFTTFERPPNASVSDWTFMQSCYESLQRLIQFRQQELESIVSHACHLRDKSAILNTAVVSLMSLRQQSAVQKVVEATQKDGYAVKEIAEATRKDSTSIKILALVTMLFLLPTAAISIMAIPSMFDSSREVSPVPPVNLIFWISFAIVIPLTLITLLVAWSWLKWESNGRPLTYITSLPWNQKTWKWESKWRQSSSRRWRNPRYHEKEIV